jgi:hypothetical protein
VGRSVCSCERLLVSCVGDDGVGIGLGDKGLSKGIEVGSVRSSHATDGVDEGAIEELEVVADVEAFSTVGNQRIP